MKALLNLYGFMKEVEINSSVAPKNLSYSLIQENKGSAPKELIGEDRKARIPIKTHNIYMENAIFEFVKYEERMIPTHQGFEKEEVAIYKVRQQKPQ